MMSLKKNSSEWRILPPWVEHPFRLISWFDMNKFSAAIFVNLGASLHWFGTLFEKGEWTEETIKSAERFGEGIADDLKAISCDVAERAAVRFGCDVHGMKSGVEIKTRTDELQQVIFDEMRKHLFFWVPPERARYYEFPEDPNKWNETEKALDGIIKDRFSRAVSEIKEARICYSIGRNTACVFHLMRAGEVAIKAIYKTLNLPPPKLSDSWGNLLKPMDAQLALPVAQRVGAWSTESQFFDHVTNDVRAVKRAWRDTTMHIENNYDESGAMKALNAITSLFEHLAMKLDQDGNLLP